MRYVVKFIFSMFLVTVLIGACSQPTTQDEQKPTQVVEPASENCGDEEDDTTGICTDTSSEKEPQPTADEQEPVELANPASTNCIERGGTLTIETLGDGGQYGVCSFEDGMACEEWAMFRGECSAGGIKTTGYVTPASRFCAITGGEYAITDNNNTEEEQGTCTYENGKTCDVWELFNGECHPNS